MRKEIEKTFVALDTEEPFGFLTKSELVSMFKPQAPDNGLSMLKAEQAIIAIDQNKDGRLSKDEFIDFVLKK
jgi:Ca2+-binding EF-hand superfamily protein